MPGGGQISGHDFAAACIQRLHGASIQYSCPPIARLILTANHSSNVDYIGPYTLNSTFAKNAFPYEKLMKRRVISLISMQAAVLLARGSDKIKAVSQTVGYNLNALLHLFI